MHAATGWIRSFGQNGPSATRISTGASCAFIASGTCESFRTTVTGVPVAARTTVSFAGTGTRAEASASVSTGPTAFVVTTATARTSGTSGAFRITGTVRHAAPGSVHPGLRQVEAPARVVERVEIHAGLPDSPKVWGEIKIALHPSSFQRSALECRFGRSASPA
jgi:hypothetical protein